MQDEIEAGHLGLSFLSLLGRIILMAVTGK